MNDESDYGSDDNFATPEIKAILSYHCAVIGSFSKLTGKTSPELKEFLLETAARIYDLVEQLPIPKMLNS